MRGLIGVQKKARGSLSPGQNEHAWARAHQDWLLPQWGNVLFSDESRFGLVSEDYRERVWRERGGQNRLATAIEAGEAYLWDSRLATTLLNTFAGGSACRPML
nr:unnamed protein product [Callosobruchus chinensis]